MAKGALRPEDAAVRFHDFQGKPAIYTDLVGVTGTQAAGDVGPECEELPQSTAIRCSESLNGAIDCMSRFILILVSIHVEVDAPLHWLCTIHSSFQLLRLTID